MKTEIISLCVREAPGFASQNARAQTKRNTFSFVLSFVNCRLQFAKPRARSSIKSYAEQQWMYDTIFFNAPLRLRLRHRIGDQRQTTDNGPIASVTFFDELTRIERHPRPRRSKSHGLESDGSSGKARDCLSRLCIRMRALVCSLRSSARRASAGSG